LTMNKTAPAGQPVRPGARARLRLGVLIGSGDRIGAFVLCRYASVWKILMSATTADRGRTIP